MAFVLASVKGKFFFYFFFTGLILFFNGLTETDKTKRGINTLYKKGV